MALSTQQIVLVKQKARAFGSQSPANGLVLKAFWHWLATHKSNPDLQFIPFSNLTADADKVGEACKLYFVYLKKQATATDAYFKVFDAANDATATDARVGIPLLVASEEAIYFSPAGFSLATGCTVGSYTAFTGSNGSTPSTSGDGPDGFLIVGKA